MTLLAPTLEAFFTERLMNQRQASPNTLASYRDAFRLLLCFLRDRTGKPPCTLQLEDLDAPAIGAFLDHLERDRGNSATTRNARLVAVHSLFGFAAFRHPEHAALIQRVLAIQPKRTDRALVSFLTAPEIDALLAAPDRSTWIGRRDQALLVVAVQTGLRVSELTGLSCGDVQLGTGPHLRCYGKGRKERATPFTTTTAGVVRSWLAERHGRPTDPLFPTRTGGRLSRDAVERLLRKYATNAAHSCPTLKNKRLAPHALRHTAALQLLRAGVDPTVIALWLGHADVRSVNVYLHADLTIKERALARTAPPNIKPGRYRPPDPLLHFLEDL